MKLLSCSRAFSIAIILSTTLFYGILPSTAQASYTPGVKAGDWVKYAEITASWQTSDPSQQKPSDLQEFERQSWLRLEVQTVNGANITGKLLIGLRDGTESSQMFAVNVRDGWGNLTIGSTNSSSWRCRWACILAGGLNTTDDLFDIATYGFNNTLTRSYAGASREVNILTVTFGSGPTIWTFYWDKATGVLVEFKVVDSSTYGTYTSSGSASVKAVETSLWSPTILGLPVVVFYATVAGLFVVAGLVAVVFLRRKRSSASTRPTTKGDALSEISKGP